MWWNGRCTTEYNTVKRNKYVLSNLLKNEKKNKINLTFDILLEWHRVTYFLLK